MADGLGASEAVIAAARSRFAIDVPLAAYASGGMASGIVSAVPSVLLLYFCTQVIRLSPLAATLIVALPKLTAVVIDPLIGSIFDQRARQRHGRFWLMASGAVIVCAGLVLVFSPPSLTESGLMVWVLTSYLFMSQGYALFAIGHVSMPAIFADGADTRRKWASARMLLVFVGILAGSAIAPGIIAGAGGGRHGHQAMAILLSLLCLVALIGPLMLVWKQPYSPVPSRPDQAPLFAGLRIPAFRRLYGAYLFQLTAVGMISSVTPFLITNAAGHDLGDVGTVLGAYLVGAMASAPFWTRLADRHGESRTLRCAAAAYALSALLIILATTTHWPWYQLIAAYLLAGISFFAMQALPYALASHLAVRLVKSSSLGAGAATGLWTATEKLGLALGPAATGLLLIVFHGQPSTAFAWTEGAVIAALVLASIPLLDKKDPDR